MDFVTTGRNIWWRLRLGNNGPGFHGTRQETLPWVGDIHIANINGDAYREILAQISDSRVRASWGSQSRLWDTYFDFHIGAGIKNLGAADVQGNGRDAILAFRELPAGDVLTVRQPNASLTDWHLAYDRGLIGSATAMAAVDCDGDDDQDVIVKTNMRLHVFRANANGVLYDVASYPSTGGSGEKGIASGDFNQDGIVDIFYASGYGFVRRFGIGGCTFGPPTSASISEANVKAGDFDGDGRLDLVFWTNEPYLFSTVHVRFYLGHGNGYFNPPIDINPEIYPGFGWGYLQELDLADFNDDGAPDLIAVSNAGIRVLYSTP